MTHGVWLEPNSVDEATMGRAVLRYLEAEGAELVIVHGLSWQWAMNLVRYLPERVRRILIMHSSSAASYRAARALTDYVHATIAVSPRIAEDLVRGHGFSSEWTACIPNAADTDKFKCRLHEKEHTSLRILSHGRIEDQSKGVYWIPEILSHVRSEGLNFELTVSGEGPDRPKLQSLIDKLELSRLTRFVGWTPAEDVPALMAQHDILLFPSRSEGLPMVLVEAMAAGCVPVASWIAGITEFVVTDGKSGLLFPVGKTMAAAQAITELGRDPQLLRRMGNAARCDALERFSYDAQARSLGYLVDRVMKTPRRLNSTLSMAQWQIPAALRPAWWYGFPEPIKRSARFLCERFRPVHSSTIVGDLMNSVVRQIRMAIVSVCDSRVSFVAWPFLSLHRTLARKRLNWTYRDSDGDWRDCNSRITFVRPGVESAGPKLAARNLKDFWLYAYDLQAGDVVVDIGAGDGDEAAIFSQMVGPSGRVVAIEANPRSFRRLVKTIETNRLPNVIVLNVAVTDGAGDARISDDKDSLANHILSGDGIRVPAVTLDQALDSVSVTQPDLIKMNIEGAEVLALRGACHTLQHAKNWVVSCHDFLSRGKDGSALCTHRQVRDILTGAGLSLLPSRDDVREPVPFYVYASRLGTSASSGRGSGESTGIEQPALWKRESIGALTY